MIMTKENSPTPFSNPWGHIPCPCTTFEQDEDCPVGFPSLLCAACSGTGNATQDTVVALAAEMLKVAEQVDELEDPFAAWESIDLLKSDNTRLRDTLKPFARIADMEEKAGPIASVMVNVARCRDARAALAIREATPAKDSPVSIVRVKPLQWNGIEAPSPAGSYRVQRLDDKWEPLHNGSLMLPKQHGVVAAFDSVDDAKAACQADYETRILSALSATATEGE